MTDKPYVGTTFLKDIPPQHQNVKPGLEKDMNPPPVFQHMNYNMPSNRLLNKVAIITGGDSGIGRAVAVAFAKEGADIAILYLNEHEDANMVKSLVEGCERKCMLIPGDIGDEAFCIDAVNKVINNFGKIDILVNNAGEHYPKATLQEITKEQLERTFKINVFSAFYLSKAVLPHLKEGASIINTTSVVAYKGSEKLIDYTATKGALVGFTRSLALALAPQGVRVNAVAPGPIWTPLIPSSISEQEVSQFGKDTPLGRAGQPVELAQAYVFLASDAASYIVGETIHVNGGIIVNG